MPRTLTGKSVIPFNCPFTKGPRCKKGLYPAIKTIGERFLFNLSGVIKSFVLGFVGSIRGAIGAKGEGALMRLGYPRAPFSPGIKPLPHNRYQNNSISMSCDFYLFRERITSWKAPKIEKHLCLQTFLKIYHFEHAGCENF